MQNKASEHFWQLHNAITDAQLSSVCRSGLAMCR